MSKMEKIKEFWEQNPTMPSEQVSQVLGISRSQARQVKSVSGLTNRKHSEVLESLLQEQQKEISRLKAIILSLLSD